MTPAIRDAALPAARNGRTERPDAGRPPPEENLPAGTGLTRLDDHLVRRWDPWYR